MSLRAAPRPRLIVDFDKPGSPLGPEAERCDYLFVAQRAAGGSWVALLELKRGRLHAGQAVRQLQAGASAAGTLISAGEQIEFRPVVASGSTPKAERQRLRNKNNRVQLCGRTEFVRLISCGAPLTKALG